MRVSVFFAKLAHNSLEMSTITKGRKDFEAANPKHSVDSGRSLAQYQNMGKVKNKVGIGSHLMF